MCFSSSEEERLKQGINAWSGRGRQPSNDSDDTDTEDSDDDLFAEHTGTDPQNAAAVAAMAESLGFETAGKHPDVVKNEVFEAKVEDALEGPIFVIDYPSSICPLTKRKADDPTIAERFELFVQGMEVANAYTELNNPDLQEELFREMLVFVVFVTLFLYVLYTRRNVVDGYSMQQALN